MQHSLQILKLKIKNYETSYIVGPLHHLSLCPIWKNTSSFSSNTRELFNILKGKMMSDQGLTKEHIPDFLHIPKFQLSHIISLKK